MKPTLKALFQAWVANLGRAPLDAEAEEFNRAFTGENLEFVRRALDEFFEAGPQWPTIPGLRVVFGRLKMAAEDARRPYSSAAHPQKPSSPEDEARAAEEFARYWESCGDRTRAEAALERAAKWRSAALAWERPRHGD